MTNFDPHGSREKAGVEGAGKERAAVRLPAAAQHSLDQIAEALGVTNALLSQDPSAVTDGSGRVRLAEATELLQAFIRIGDAEARRRCLDFVRDTALRRSPDRA
ncbi:hypothetical protein J2X36_001386 [Methylobacterium sp. BE186]|uniref:hypothetical protein n=1 Tax=Methylobacterium sp. BE186 TaxID=2817715 RepID=UPI0028632687|nr:hypothetical protein [Methylobacterium sp. BE186]MDR7036645.1 hypothetical protein [Methylobacterium sp. BE186]